MIQYQDLLREVAVKGKRRENRTGISTFGITGAMLKFDMADGFPAMTTKRLAFAQVVGELLGFIRAYDNAEQFRALGCRIWDANANKNTNWLANPNRKGLDDLGRIYGIQWRDFRGKDLVVDQLQHAIYEILTNPTSRRIVVNAWNPCELDRMALPPCHVLHQYHVNPDEGSLSLTMYQRSCDLFLGVPFNIASYALLLHLVAWITGLRANSLVMFLADVHIYENHLEQVRIQLERDPLVLPTLKIHLGEEPFKPSFWQEAMINLSFIKPSQIELLNYRCHPTINAPMAV